LSTNIETGSFSPTGLAQYTQSINNALNEIDQVFGKILSVHTSLGGRLNAIEDQTDNNAAKKLQLETVLSEIRDLDYAEAISKMTIQTTALQVAQQTFVKVQDLSLFKFI